MSRRGSILTFGLLAAAALLAPLAEPASSADAGPAEPWPSRFEGRAIVPLAPAPEDRLLARSFPGHVARFSDGRRQVVLRQVNAPTRRLHPAADCFRAVGYAIGPSPMRVGAGGRPASCFTATRGGRTVRVCEQIIGADGRSWPDVSSWYWPALAGTASGPWLATLTVERVRQDVT
ncbi:MAG TPA: hypothetical protein VFQ67_02665 [Allosphingosinicella sp.]|jgi:hypothetical protein|nr:hypothetical protein [Allosphingosinicella sp.]